MSNKKYKQDNSRRTRNKGIYLMLTEEETNLFNVMCSQLGLTKTDCLIKALTQLKGV